MRVVHALLCVSAYVCVCVCVLLTLSRCVCVVFACTHFSIRGWVGEWVYIHTCRMGVYTYLQSAHSNGLYFCGFRSDTWQLQFVRFRLGCWSAACPELVAYCVRVCVCVCMHVGACVWVCVCVRET